MTYNEHRLVEEVASLYGTAYRGIGPLALPLRRGREAEAACAAVLHSLRREDLEHFRPDLLEGAPPMSEQLRPWDADGGDPYGRTGDDQDEDDQAAAPIVTLGPGDKAPWEDLGLDCPRCGEGPLEVQKSNPAGLTYISHCGGAWLRGPLTL